MSPDFYDTIGRENSNNLKGEAAGRLGRRGGRHCKLIWMRTQRERKKGKGLQKWTGGEGDKSLKN